MSPQISHLGETGNLSFPALKLTLESRLLGIYRGKRGRKNIFSVLVVNPAPPIWKLSSTGSKGAQPAAGLGLGAVKVE